MAISYEKKKKNRYPKNAALLIAFPTSGKTTLARNVTGVMDLDFGHFRAAFECTKRGELCIIPIFTRLIRRYLAEGWVVVTNEPAILPFLNQDELDITEGFLPFDERIAAQRLYTSVSRIKIWEQDWRGRFEYYGIPVTKLKVPLAVYFTKGQEPDDELVDEPLDDDAGLSPTAVHSDSVEEAARVLGYAVRDASPGLRSYPVEDDDNE